MGEERGVVGVAVFYGCMDGGEDGSVTAACCSSSFIKLDSLFSSAHLQPLPSVCVITLPSHDRLLRFTEKLIASLFTLANYYFSATSVFGKITSQIEIFWGGMQRVSSLS